MCACAGAGWSRVNLGFFGAGPGRCGRLGPAGGAAGAAVRERSAGSGAGCCSSRGLRRRENTCKLWNGCITATLCVPARNYTSSVTLKVAFQERLPAQTRVLFFKCTWPRDCFQKPVFKYCQYFTYLKCLLDCCQGAFLEQRMEPGHLRSRFVSLLHHRAAKHTQVKLSPFPKPSCTGSCWQACCSALDEIRLD